MTYTETSSRPTTDDASDVSRTTTNSFGQAAPKPFRSWFSASIAASTAALQACGGGGESPLPNGSSGGISTPNVSAQATLTSAGRAAVTQTTVAGGASGPLNWWRTYVTPSDDSDAVRYLLQAQFSASETDIQSVRTLGYAGWLAKQFDVPAGLRAWDWLNARGYSNLATNTFYNTYPADHALWNQLIASPDALRKRVTLALSEIFVISTNGINTAWPSFVVGSWWDMLSDNAFGNFRKLLEDVTLHPAMGNYLNIRGSQKENAAGRQPDENYAREIMQLMTIGLVNLNANGTTAGWKATDTYQQSDVINLARVFTGYDFDWTGVTQSVAASGEMLPSLEFTKRPMVQYANLHSTLEVKFLGVTIPAGTDGPTSRKIALDTLFNHGNVGPFIGKQLIQRLVTANPSPSYVARVSQAFADNGKGVRGDLAAVIAAVLLDDEARGPAGLVSSTYGHVREPMVRMVQWARQFGLTSASGSWKIGDLSSPGLLGQSPLRSGSVFNFFRPGYVPPSTAIASRGLVAPEFQLVNETSVSAYLNLLQGAIYNGIQVSAPNIPQYVWQGPFVYDMQAAYTVEKTLATDAAALVARLNLVLTANQLSASTVALMVSALNANPVTSTTSDALKFNRVCSAVLMVMASPEYLVQK